jgi:hypothetical protein
MKETLGTRGNVEGFEEGKEQGCHISLGAAYQNGKIKPNDHKIHQNGKIKTNDHKIHIPNDHKIYQMTTKYTK